MIVEEGHAHGVEMPENLNRIVPSGLEIVLGGLETSLIDVWVRMLRHRRSMIGIPGNIMVLARLPNCPVIREQYAWDEDIVTIESGVSGGSGGSRLNGEDQRSYDGQGEGNKLHRGQTR